MTKSHPTIQDNVRLACERNNQPIDWQVYILAMIELAGGNYQLAVPSEQLFINTMERIGDELDMVRTICEEVPLEMTH